MSSGSSSSLSTGSSTAASFDSDSDSDYGFSLHTLRDKLALLKRTRKKTGGRKLLARIDPIKKDFSFGRVKGLFPIRDDEVKGFPCIAYDTISDVMKFGIKVNPLQSKYPLTEHPTHLEARIMRLLQNRLKETPHITSYFGDRDMPNNCRGLTDFPLKYMSKRIHRTSNVLLTEYVTGGSLDSLWRNDKLDLTLPRMKYVVFGILWTLAILQDRHQFMHNDCHHGNVLLDTAFDTSEKTYVKYTWKDPKNKVSQEFYIPFPGVMAKLWDFEFANVFRNGGKAIFHNPFTDDHLHIPPGFNRIYDAHYFLTSLLEIDIPDELRHFIMTVYPPELIPKEFVHSHESSSRPISDNSSYTSLGSSNSNTSSSPTESSSVDSEDMYYKTDEEMSSTDDEESSSADGDESSSSTDTADTTTESEPVLVDDGRIINTAYPHIDLKRTPTAVSLLFHPFFAEYMTAPTDPIDVSAEFTYLRPRCSW